MSWDHEPFVAFDIQRRREETIKLRRAFVDEVSKALKIADPSMSDIQCLDEAKILWKERLKKGADR